MRAVISILILSMVLACKDKPKQTETISKEMEKEEIMENEWITLFDGSSFEGWHFYGGDTMGEPWKLEDSAMVFYPPSERPEGTSYNIVTDQEFENFVLSLEWKISKNGNSGIFWGIFEDEKYGQPYETGPEIQVLDNVGHPDAKNGLTRQAGALYDMMETNLEACNPAGEWNHILLTIDHAKNQGMVALNDTKLFDFPVHGTEWDAMVANSKFATWEGFGKYPMGKIGLQDHGDIVAYRNIKIKKL